MAMIVEVLGKAEGTDSSRETGLPDFLSFAPSYIVESGAVRLAKVIQRISAEMKEVYDFYFTFLENVELEKEWKGKEDEEERKEEAPPYWEGLYLLLSLYEKVLLYLKFTQIEKYDFVLPKLWLLLPTLLSHSHVWIRCASFLLSFH
jgi:hypothetical protein